MLEVNLIRMKQYLIFSMMLMLGWKTCQTFQSDINDATEHYYKMFAQATTAHHGFCSNMFLDYILVYSTIFWIKYLIHNPYHKQTNVAALFNILLKITKLHNEWKK